METVLPAIVGTNRLMVGKAECAALLNVSERTIDRLDAAEKIPAPDRVLTADPRWSVAELKAWVDADRPPRAEWDKIRRRRK